MNTNEEMKKLYKELSGYAQIDDILDAIDKIADEYNKSNQEHTQECDGDCENCKYGTEQMDDYAYEYGYRDIPQDLEEFMNGKYDSVSHPFHYTSHGLETISKIEAVIDGLPAKEAALLSNVLKYFDRAGLKDDATQDLNKANNYAHRLVYGHWRKQQ